MKNLVKYVIVFSIGIATGAIGANLVLTKRYEDLLQDEIDYVRRREAVEPNPDPSVNIEDGRDGCPHEYATDIPNYEEHSEPKSGFTPDQIKNLVLSKDKYKKIARQYGEVKEMLPTYNKPYIISVDQYSNGSNDYEKLVVYYYAGDDTLVNEDETVMTEVHLIMSDNTASHLLGDSDSPDAVYVRNEKIQTDYEVICIGGSYSDIVLGRE